MPSEARRALKFSSISFVISFNFFCTYSLFSFSSGLSSFNCVAHVLSATFALAELRFNHAVYAESEREANSGHWIAQISTMLLFITTELHSYAKTSERPVALVSEQMLNSTAVSTKYIRIDF